MRGDLKFNCLQLKAYKGYLYLKAIKLQSGNKLHHYWLSQYIKAIVLHQREFEFEFWPIRKFHFYSARSCSIHHLELLSNQMTAFPFTILNSCPVTGWVAILNYCPIRRLLSIRHLEFMTNQRQAAPPYPLPPWHRTLTSTLLSTSKWPEVYGWLEWHCAAHSDLGVLPIFESKPWLSAVTDEKEMRKSVLTTVI